jgi:cysteine synthase
MARRYLSILETIGNTPVVRINRLAPAGANLFVKIEAFNPLGSVKDRLALGKDLATKEGIFVGITSGATFAGALEAAAGAERGSNILCMLPDTGERYLSTPLFADISADMNEEELAISRSTPGAQSNT